jgi:LysM repeat protein
VTTPSGPSEAAFRPEGPQRASPADAPGPADAAGPGPAVDRRLVDGSVPDDDDDGGGDDAEAVAEPRPDDTASSACPYLAAAGGWRSTGATREHRCTALDPAAAIALEKQRRLCLLAAHRTCPTYIAARTAREQALTGLPAGWAPGRRLVRTSPVVIEAAPRRRTIPFSPGSHRLAEGAVAVMALVVVVLVGSRIVGGAAPEPTSKPTPSATAGPVASEVAGVASPLPSPDAGSPSPSPAASAAATASAEASSEPSPSASAAKRTYTVRSGDTLSGIGAKFGVTWQAIAKANRIKSPYRIVRGQVLVIP